jgi:DNA-binding Lrp family transcriptional regulator
MDVKNINYTKDTANTKTQKIKLDLKDKKILALLDEDSRYSNSQIAKKVGLSKPAVEYRIQRMLKNNIIFEFYSVINFSKLGYSLYKLYLKLQNTTNEEENSITNYWVKSKNTVWVAQCRGGKDIAVTILARKNSEFGNILSLFMNKYSKFILDKEILLNESTSIYLKDENQAKKEFTYETQNITHYELEDEDIKILKELSVNARINIVDLAEKIKLTRDMVNYRLKKLIKENIISQYRCYLNLENIGMNLYKVIIRTRNFDDKEYKRLRDYCSSHKNIPQVLKLIGSWDLEIEFETEGEDELYKILNEFRKEFSNIIRDFDIIRITKINKYNYFPF